MTERRGVNVVPPEETEPVPLNSVQFGVPPDPLPWPTNKNVPLAEQADESGPALTTGCVVTVKHTSSLAGEQVAAPVVVSRKQALPVT